MHKIVEPITVRFPLSGEWCAVNTPGHMIPSHGTDSLGQSYAYDFFQIDWDKIGYKFYNTPILRSLIFGVQLKDTFCWSKPIYAPFDGEVIETNDGVEERNPVHIARDLAVVIKNGLFFRGKSNDELHPVLGNFVILKRDENVFCLIAHARRGSVRVAKAEKVKEGQEIAQVGHSGNSTAPHLHFQLMARPNLIDAKGLPCCFNNYQAYCHGSWMAVEKGIPGKRERIRS